MEARKVAARLPARDLERARAWYAEKLGLEPVEERPGGLLYAAGGAEFALFASAGASDGSFTQMGFEVADLRATVAALRARGVVFEEYDEGPLRTEDGIATIDGNYPSKGRGDMAPGSATARAICWGWGSLSRLGFPCGRTPPA